MRTDVLLIFALTCALTAPIAACDVDDIGIEIDIDPLFDELACEYESGARVPYESSGGFGGFSGGGGEGGESALGSSNGVMLNGIRNSPHAPVPISSEAEYTLTFNERPSLLQVQASGALEVTHVGAVQCGPNDSNSSLPFVVNLRVRSSETVGDASLAVSLAGEEVATYDLSVARAEDIETAALDPATAEEVTELEPGREYLFGAAPLTASEDYLYFHGPADLELLAGSAEINPYLFSASGFVAWSLRPVEAGELKLRVTTLGLTKDLTFAVADPM